MEKQNNNNKKTVLKISTGHKPLSYRNHKTGKVKEKKISKEMHRQTIMRDTAHKEP